MVAHKNVKERQNKLPDKITGTYTYDYNILYIHQLILTKLEREKDEITEINKKLKTLEKYVTQPQNYIVRKNNLKNIEELKKQIYDLEHDVKINQYRNKVEDLITQYKTYNKVNKISFFDDSKKEEILDQETIQHLIVIEQYLEIAGKYMDLQVVRHFPDKDNCCRYCGESLEDVMVLEEGFKHCPNCHVEHFVLDYQKSNKENHYNPPDDESIENFLRAFDRYQGVQAHHSLEAFERLYINLDQYFSKHRLRLGAEVRKLPFNSRGRRGDTTHKMLWKALSEISAPEFYEDVNYIGHCYWGWILPDIMKYRETIISHYNKTQKVFYEIPIEKRERDSSLGTQFRLWRHLQLVGYECYIHEFKIAENPESLRIHNKLWKMMCEGTNDPKIYYIE